MRKFQFRLQTLLDFRRRREEEGQQELARQEGLLADLQKEKKSLLDQATEQRRKLLFPEGHTLSVEDIRSDRKLLDRLEAGIQKKDEEIEQGRQERERLVDALVELKRERETVDKLKEKDFEKWRRDANRKEQGFLDEIGSMASARRRRESGQARTTILLIIMAILTGLLIYVTFFESGQKWMEGLAARMDAIKEQVLSGEGGQVDEPGEEGEGEGEAVAGEAAEVEQEPALESVRKERERLAAWEQSLEQQEKEVQLELVALAELRDEIEQLRQEVEKETTRLEELRREKESEEAKERETRLNKLAGFYTNARAKEAARMMMEVDNETAVEIMHRMRERDISKIVTEMGKIDEEVNGRTGPQRAQELLDLYAEKALELSVP